jgi:2-polyprenyl-3-methyl-5-hydroxy-6-metoxy-1,4-benzoquinol methylase
MSDPAFKYFGEELRIFSEAVCWKSYWSSQIREYLGQRILEVGAGIGGTTRSLCTQKHEIWLALEPDQIMAKKLNEQIEKGNLPNCCQIQCGTLDDLALDQLFNTILYVDVLEHIEDDFSELQKAARLLHPGGYLVILAPAYQWLYTEFDQAIGHYRRYTRAALLNLTPRNMRCIKAIYLDSFGLLAVMGNRFLLRATHPNRQTVLFWDKYMVILSQLLDPIVSYSFGKSILVVWQRQL